MTETEFVALLRSLPLHPGARALADDAAVIPFGDRALVLTHDMIVEGVHYLPGTDPDDIAWRLVATNLSDLAAKGARPLGVLTGLMLGPDDAHDRALVAGLGAALAAFGCALLGGDTVAAPAGAVRSHGLTALGWTDGAVPDRRGARTGDTLWVTGTIGDAGLGLRIARGEIDGPDRLRAAHLRPMPRLAEGQALAPHVTAMMDVSDGLLVDAARLAQASGLAVAIDLDAVPLSADAVALAGDDRAGRLAAATAGDDYQLLFTLPPGRDPPLAATAIGRCTGGRGLTVTDRGRAVALPAGLGWVHGAAGHIG